MTAGVGLLSGGSLVKRSWAAAGSGKGSLRLVFYTDTHARTEWETPLALEKAAYAINGKNPDLVIAGGDLVTDGLQSFAASVEPRWQAYMKMHRAIKADLYPTMGNNDLVAAIPEDGSPPTLDPREVYLSHMGLDSTYYSFNAVGYHFVILDSILITSGKLKYQGMISREQLEWLKQDLDSVQASTPVVLVTHIPLLTAFYSATKGATFAAKSNRVVTNNLEVLSLIKNHNVILVLQGHLHISELIRWRDITFIVGGAVCGQWWRGPWYGTQEGFNLLTLTGNRVDWEYIDYGWEERRPRGK
jgi:3',5'-cyclic AMP phosphodiesterase CpdA